MTNEQIMTGVVYAFGVGLSAVIRYWPWFSKKYAVASPVLKFVVLLIGVAVTEVVVFAAACLGLWKWVACSAEGFGQLAVVYVNILIGSQLGHLVLPKPKFYLDAKNGK